MDTWTWFQSGINTDGAHNPVTNRIIRPADILSLNCFPMIFGYYTALERTLFCDRASDEHLRLWEINCDVHRAGLALIGPGARCSEIAKELNEIYRSHDLLKYRSFGYGHSFGVLCHYYGREAGVELREDVETELKPGMVVSMEADEYGSGGRARRRRLPRARYPCRDRRRRREHHRLPLRPGTQHHRELNVPASGAALRGNDAGKGPERHRIHSAGTSTPSGTGCMRGSA